MTGNCMYPDHTPKAEAETMIEPDGVGDDFRWKAVATVKKRLYAHAYSLPVTPSN